jgi:hypothetical protein
MFRFHDFDDAVLEGIAVGFPNKGRFGTGTVVLLARDSTSGELDVWFRVRFQIEGVNEFSFIENSRYSNRVLSSGLKVQQIDGRIWMIFDQYDAVLSVDEARRSKFYICGTELHTQVASIAPS